MDYEHCREEAYAKSIVRIISIEVMETLCTIAPKDIYGDIRPECDGYKTTAPTSTLGIRG